MSSVKISIIIAAYNAEQHFQQCLDTIAEQSFEDFECIIVNDGSTDTTATIAAQYAEKDTRFRLINKENGGVSTARNAGLDAALGSYVLFLDADDYFEKNLLKTLIETAASTDADITFCNYRSYFHTMQKYSEPRIATEDVTEPVFSYKTAPDSIFTIPTLMFWNKLFKMDFIKSQGFRGDETLHRAQDIEFIGRTLVAASKIAFAPEVLVNYRTDVEDSNVQRLHKYPMDVVTALEKLHTYLEITGTYEELRASYVAIAADHLLTNLYFTETHDVHKAIFTAAKKLLEKASTLDTISAIKDTKIHDALMVLMKSNYEQWLQYRILDLRDDSESKYIAYLLGEFQRKYDEEVRLHNEAVHKYDQEHEVTEHMKNSLSWKMTQPLRTLSRLIGRSK